MQLRVGNICKFEDFEPIEGRPACFKIGQVVEIKRDAVFGETIIFRILLDIWCGENFQSALVGELCACPLPGTLYYDWPSRIQIFS